MLKNEHCLFSCIFYLFFFFFVKATGSQYRGVKELHAAPKLVIMQQCLFISQLWEMCGNQPSHLEKNDAIVCFCYPLIYYILVDMLHLICIISTFLHYVSYHVQMKCASADFTSREEKGWWVVWRVRDRCVRIHLLDAVLDDIRSFPDHVTEHKTRYFYQTSRAFPAVLVVSWTS